jgi:biotin carboxylase
MTPITTPAGLASKIAQRNLVAGAAASLAFDLRVFEEQALLHAWLRASDGTQVVRPELSDERGSALLHRASLPLTVADTAVLFERSPRVVVHRFVEGDPYFVNGVVVEGRLFATDCWRCFSIDAGIRDILTSVVNEPCGGPLVSSLHPQLQAVALASGLGDGPVHFEIVVSPDGGAKVVKFAPRLASEPLPTLCRLLGILGQSDAISLRTVAEVQRAPGFHREVGYVADYSFVVREPGTLVRINALNELRSLPSYAGDVDMPEPGDVVEATRSGETYGATVLLKHASEAALLADIERCQQLNRADVFDVEPLPGERPAPVRSPAPAASSAAPAAPARSSAAPTAPARSSAAPTAPARSSAAPTAPATSAPPRPAHAEVIALDAHRAGERLDELVLVIGCGLRHDRGYLLEGVARRARVWLFDTELPTWQTPYIEGFTQVDPSDARELTAAAYLVSQRVKPSGVLCYQEQYVQSAARVVERLGLPGFSSEAIRNCRDKRRTREALTAAGVAQPESVAVSSLEEAREVAARIGYPVVLKPRGLAGSMGVILAASEAQLDEAYETAYTPWYPGVPTYEDGVLVETYLDGPEISIDGAMVDGRYAPMFVARKQLSEHPYFQETGHVVDATDELQRQPELMEMLETAHLALGLRRGMTHSEVRLTSNGPRIVEINARLGGDLIPYVGMLATGIDPARVAVDTVVGREPHVEMSRSTAAEIRFFYPAEDSIVRAVDLPGDLPGLHLAEATARDGAILRLPPRGYLARYAQLICVASSREAARAAADAASAAVTLRYDRAPRFDGDRPDLSWLDAAIPAAAA